MKIRTSMVDHLFRAAMLALLLILLLAILASGRSVAAQQCAFGGCVQRAKVVAPAVYHAPAIKAAYVAPVYEFQYYVGQGIRDQAIAELAAERVLQLLAERLEQRAASAAPAGQQSDLQAIVNQSCIGCHSPAAPERLDLTDVSKLSELQAVDCWRRVVAGTMPKNSDPLSAEQRAVFERAVLGWNR